VNFEDHVEAIRVEGAAFSAELRHAELAAPVPSCPEWAIEDLVRHLGRVHRWTASIVEQRAQERIRTADRGPDDVNALASWFDDGVAHLVSVLQSTGPEVAIWTWGPGGTSGWWARRQAHETAVHRWDAQGASGRPEPIAPLLAVDATDEFFDNFTAVLGFEERELGGSGETIHLHCTDTAGEWLLHLDPDVLRVERLHAKGDVAARGAASNLALFVLGRVDPDQLDVFGDGTLLQRWQELARF
jgi:uncharacterized protein (TIGR03083 family)